MLSDYRTKEQSMLSFEAKSFHIIRSPCAINKIRLEITRKKQAPIFAYNILRNKYTYTRQTTNPTMLPSKQSPCAQHRNTKKNKWLWSWSLTRIVGLVADDADPLQMLELGGKIPVPGRRRAQTQQLLPGVPDDALVEHKFGEGPTLTAISAWFAPGATGATRAARPAVTDRTSSAARRRVRGSDALGQISEGAARPTGVGGLAQAVGAAAAAVGSLVSTASGCIVIEGESGKMVDVATALSLGLATAADLIPAVIVRICSVSRGRTARRLGCNFWGCFRSGGRLKAFSAAA